MEIPMEMSQGRLRTADKLQIFRVLYLCKFKHQNSESESIGGGLGLASI